MNQKQRKYLIKEVEQSGSNKVASLSKSKPKEPKLSKFMESALAANRFELLPLGTIKENILERFLTGTKVFEGGSSWNDDGDYFKIHLEKIFVLPDGAREAYENWKEECTRIDKEIESLNIKAKGLITRITLASPERLQRMIDEVDDMGDLSLMDETLRLVAPISEAPKQLNSGE